MQLGIDIGGSSVKAAAVENGRVAWVGQSGFYARPDKHELQEAIRQAVVGRVAKIERVGICAPGLFDKAQRKITYAINVPGIAGVSLDRFVPETLGVEESPATLICNDTAAAAMDIWLDRRLSGRLAVLALGTGIGMAVLDDGQPVRVEGESPGHIGQVDVSIAGQDVIGPDGGAGGLEGYLGVAALRRKYGDDLWRALEKFDGEELAMLALVRAIRIVHAIYRPNHICLCGGIGIRLKHILAILRAKIETNLTNLARADWTFTTGEDVFHAARGAAWGAARLAGG